MGGVTQQDSTCVQSHTFETPLGAMIATAWSGRLRSVEFRNQPSAGAEDFGELRGQLTPTVAALNPVLAETERQLNEYFSGSRSAFTLPLHFEGTPFQRSVWDQLQRIPCGQTRSYVDLARALGSPGGSRAIGQANGRNRLCIIIPCHRVIRAGGHLGGYSAGLMRKQWLLDHESRLVDTPTLPSLLAAG